MAHGPPETGAIRQLFLELVHGRHICCQTPGLSSIHPSRCSRCPSRPPGLSPDPPTCMRWVAIQAASRRQTLPLSRRIDALPDLPDQARAGVSDWLRRLPDVTRKTSTWPGRRAMGGRRLSRAILPTCSQPTENSVREVTRRDYWAACRRLNFEPFFAWPGIETATLDDRGWTHGPKVLLVMAVTREPNVSTGRPPVTPRDQPLAPGQTLCDHRVERREQPSG
jgi:hypothetical protein